MGRRTRHAGCERDYPVVFIPKSREPRLTGATADGLRFTFEEICDDKDFELVEAEIMPDRSKWTRSYSVGSADSVSKAAVGQYLQEQTEQQA